MIIQNRSRAGWALIRSCKQRMAPSVRKSRPILLAGATALVAALIVVAVTPNYLSRHSHQQAAQRFKVAVPAIQEPVAQSRLAALPQKNPEQPLLVALKQPETGPVPDLPHQNSTTVQQTPDSSPETSGPANSGLQEQSSASEPSQASPALSEPPRILGELTVMPGDTLGALVYKIYGTYRNRHLNALIEANPQIPDPNAIDLGDRIIFPPLRFNAASAVCPCYWLVLDESQSLPDALHQQKQLHQEIHDAVQIIGYWSPTTGLSFDLTVKGFFTNERQARARMEQLPETLATRTRIIKGWPKDARLYADPYGGGVR